MSFFGGRSAASPASSPAAGTSSDQTARKLEVMQQVRQELASAHLQELVNKMTERCYEVCLPQGRDGLSSKDQACLANCSDRFLEAFNVVSNTYVQRLNKERQQSAGGPNALSGELLS